MRLRRLLLAAALTASIPALVSTSASVAARPTPAVDPFDLSQWSLEARAHRLERHRGEEALVLEQGVAWFEGLEFENGILEVDLAMEPVQGFFGLVFRDDGRGNREHFYLRSHLSGKPDASQYDAVFNGNSGWQIYAGPRFNAPVDLTFDGWMRLKVVVAGDRAEVFVDDERILTIPKLIHGQRRGRVGLQASVAPGRFANFRVTPMAAPTITGTGAEAEPVPDSVVGGLRVSPPFAESALEGVSTLDDDDAGSWQRVDAGERGIVNLGRAAARGDGLDTVIAAVGLHVESERLVRVRFGFSDRVRVYLNGRLLYAGDDGYATRDYRFLGTIGLFDELFLPLRAGDNELSFAVSEDFGGWGLILDIPDRSGVRVEP